MSMKPLFSQRNGYTKVDDVIIRERMTEEIQNAICNCYDWFESVIDDTSFPEGYLKMEEHLWMQFLNLRKVNFHYGYNYSHTTVLTKFIVDPNNPWYRKLDIIEDSIGFLSRTPEYHTEFHNIVKALVRALNSEFSRLNFAYRIINLQVVEVTSESEVKSIEQALANSKGNIKEHLSNALKLCSIRPVGDYRNSIKESISAVEALCREKTGENTLGKALNQLEKKGIIIPSLLKSAFEKLYAYTNQEDTGIRHALMDDDGTYTPAADEAIFMLVSCSAFVNYLRKK